MKDSWTFVSLRRLVAEICRTSIRGLVICGFVIGIAPLSIATAHAQTAEEKGLEIAIEADRRDSGFGDYTGSLTMVLRNRHGEESTRQLRSHILEVEGDGDKNLIFFDSPPDIDGTALLSYTHKSGPDDQWLYLPAFKRVKRIASNNKSGPFVGSEFAYEDLLSQEVEKYTYKFLGNEKYVDLDCFMVERYPVDPKSGYTRQIVWLDQQEFRIWKIDFYDRRGSLLKTFTASDYRQYLDRFWRADKMLMVNHQSGKSTELLWRDYEFRPGLSERDFDLVSLKRSR